ncbi:RRM_1 domain-containing protein [Cephalotus follicularis]|uniref:RRM_1 domain-containing protein n=1 Tax=Cephalotus follicularis TaxID=3775 RepID=A0A1Q3BYT1_CEPFO|nr:RRM_1 domain-containing protein [Cephalotus follicularis]
MAGELGLNFEVDREEIADHAYKNLVVSDRIQVELKQPEQEQSLFSPDDLRSSYDKSYTIQADCDHDDVRITKVDFNQERTQSLSKDNHYQDANQVGKIVGNSNFDKPKSSSYDAESKGDDYSDPRSSPSDSEKMDMPLLDSHSPVANPRRSSSPATARHISVSPKKSACMHQSTSGHKPPSSPGRQRYSSPPERFDLHRGVAARDHLSPFCKRTSPSPHRPRHKDGSLNRRPVSPKTRHNHERHNRSVSRSPVCRRDSSSGPKRDYYGRSRSRSPYKRKRHRSPRRRYSPRQRSPARYHSGHQSPTPRRKPWSPPPNRRNGLGKPGKNLFVAGFNFLTTERDLERKFSRFGRVRDVRIVRDKRSGDSRGFGFLSLERDEDADAAIRALDETEWNGRVILVEKTKPTER